MRHLGAMGYIIETGEDEYKPTNFTNSLSIPIISGGYYAMFVPAFPFRSLTCVSLSFCDKSD